MLATARLVHTAITHTVTFVAVCVCVGEGEVWMEIKFVLAAGQAQISLRPEVRAAVALSAP